jgi:hypothetical protein
MTPIDFTCWGCGERFAVSVRSLGADDPDPHCPVCLSGEIGADFAALLQQAHEIAKLAGSEDDEARSGGRPAA